MGAVRQPVVIPRLNKPLWKPLAKAWPLDSLEKSLLCAVDRVAIVQRYLSRLNRRRANTSASPEPRRTSAPGSGVVTAVKVEVPEGWPMAQVRLPAVVGKIGVMLDPLATPPVPESGPSGPRRS
jgi:hypothetical protein